MHKVNQHSEVSTHRIAGSNAILVVDDDPDDHHILQVIFQRIGVLERAKFFSDAREVIQYLRESHESPFLILCDINMPNMTGFDLRQTLLSDSLLKKKSIPFVFYSTAATNSQVEDAFELTVQGFFEKGFSLEECEKKIRITLEYWNESKRPECRS